MTTVTIFSNKGGLKEDTHLHQPILESVNFTKTPAFKFAMKRAMALGLTEAQAKSVLTPPPEG